MTWMDGAGIPPPAHAVWPGTETFGPSSSGTPSSFPAYFLSALITFPIFYITSNDFVYCLPFEWKLHEEEFLCLLLTVVSLTTRTVPGTKYVPNNILLSRYMNKC